MRKMREAVDREYPDAEKEKTESERQGTIPQSNMALLRDTREAEEEEQADREPARKRRRQRLLDTKNATPGDGARTLEECLDDIRPWINTHSRALTRLLCGRQLWRGMEIYTSRQEGNQSYSSIRSTSPKPSLVPYRECARAQTSF